MRINQCLNLVTEFKLAEDLLHVGREAIKVVDKVVAQALPRCAGLELCQREVGGVVKRLPRSHAQRPVLFRNLVGVEELLAIQHRLL
ncbi:hypothetical protein D3C86_1123130 [compost metagenome]